jgi:RNA polymerase sigma-70 factor, ECF subfamily
MMDQPVVASDRARYDRQRHVIADRGEGTVMEPNDSFAELGSRLRTGDQGAASEVFRRFAGRLIAPTRTELDARLRRKMDPEDVVQSVYRSFFTRYSAGQFDLATWESLWGLLAVITVRKCLGRAEYYLAQCRTVAGEGAVATRDEDGASGLSEAIDR